MTGFYVYRKKEDGSEPVGSTDRAIYTDLKTAKGVMRRVLKSSYWDKGTYSIYQFNNLFDNERFIISFEKI